MTGSYLRSCAGCSAHLLSNDPTTPKTYCNKCRPKYVSPWDEWAAAVQKNSTVYVQPLVAWRGLSRSKYLVVERDGDRVTLQLIGVPESRFETTIAQCGQHDMTPRSRTFLD